MVAFIARNSTESVGLKETMADAPLTMLTLAKEYTSIPAKIYELPE